MPVTVQTGANQFTKSDITKYSLMMGGLNVTHDALKQYDPLIGGYYRLFMVRKPLWVDRYFSTGSGLNRFTAFKHILEYGNIGVSGINGTEMTFESLKGGYSGKEFEIPSYSSNGTNEFSVKVYEFSGSPIREVLDTWINGTSDENGGVTHYGGLIASGQVPYSQANQTAEFIYVLTDRTGMKVEFACMFANCFPKQVPMDHLNADAGEHSMTQLDISFTCTMYKGVDVTEKAKILLKNHQIMTNSLEFYTGLDLKDAAFTEKRGYNPKTGTLDSISGSKLGDGENEVQYRTALTNADATATSQNVNLEDYQRPTPSYTDIGNRTSI